MSHEPYGKAQIRRIERWNETENEKKSLKTERKGAFCWFVHNVWPPSVVHFSGDLSASCLGAFVILGRGADDGLKPEGPPRR